MSISKYAATHLCKPNTSLTWLVWSLWEYHRSYCSFSTRRVNHSNLFFTTTTHENKTNNIYIVCFIFMGGCCEKQVGIESTTSHVVCDCCHLSNPRTGHAPNTTHAGDNGETQNFPKHCTETANWVYGYVLLTSFLRYTSFLVVTSSFCPSRQLCFFLHVALRHRDVLERTSSFELLNPLRNDQIRMQNISRWGGWEQPASSRGMIMMCYPGDVTSTIIVMASFIITIT